jgi:hypothetical protein
LPLFFLAEFFSSNVTHFISSARRSPIIPSKKGDDLPSKDVGFDELGLIESLVQGENIGNKKHDRTCAIKLMPDMCGTYFGFGFAF